MSTHIQINQKVTDLWLKAAIAGGLWASVEIIIGSFLHNLKIPFAGSILASFGIILMVAFFQLWPERGLIIRAGLICALMKSISPSAVILGPMTGILAEAMLLELGIFLFGRNIVGFLLGGSMALFSALAHKVISLLILYGTNIIKIYLGIFLFASRQINLPNSDPMTMVSVLALIYVIIGAAAALVGYLAGKKAIKKTLHSEDFTTETAQDKNFFQVNPKQEFRVPFLFMHIILLPAGLFIITKFSYLVYLPIIICYLTFCLIYYKNIIRKLFKFFFWFQLALIVLLATVFWNLMTDTPENNHLSGLWIGLEMTLRAIYVVIAFSSLGVELRNPKIKEVIFRKGFSQLYLALNLAFAALPSMLVNLAPSRKKIKNPFSFFPLLLSQANLWHNTLREHTNESN
jgi:hypothetical protein